MHNGARTARRRVVRIRFAATMAITLSLFLFTFSHADMFWQEDFEAPTNLGNWTRSSPSMPYVSSSLPYQGLQSLRLDYNGPIGGGYMDRSHPRTPEIWTRFYYRTNAFTYEPTTGTKHFYHLDLQTSYPTFVWENRQGSREISLYVQVPAEACAATGHPAYDACFYVPNMASIPLNDDQWYCIETRVKMNTPDVSNGVAEEFVTPVGSATSQVMGYYTLKFRGPNVRNPSGCVSQCNSSNAELNFLRIYRQAGIGTMWYDNFAVGSTRIGCSGGSTPPTSTPSTTSAPTTPSGVTFR